MGLFHKPTTFADTNPPTAFRRSGTGEMGERTETLSDSEPPRARSNSSGFSATSFHTFAPGGIAMASFHSFPTNADRPRRPLPLAISSQSLTGEHRPAFRTSSVPPRPRNPSAGSTSHAHPHHSTPALSSASTISSLELATSDDHTSMPVPSPPSFNKKKAFIKKRGKRHHAFSKSRAPYPVSYESNVLDQSASYFICSSFQIAEPSI